MGTPPHSPGIWPMNRSIEVGPSGCGWVMSFCASVFHSSASDRDPLSIRAQLTSEAHYPCFRGESRMSVFNLRLESVQRKTGGRIHLTPKVPRSGPVTTLCGKDLPAGSFIAVDAAADCTICQRRSRDPSRISGAFFAQEEGSQLLQPALEQARARPPAGKAALPPGKPIVRVLPPPPSVPDRVGELVTDGFK